MKVSTFLNLLALVAVLSISGMGCKKFDRGVTPIPGQGGVRPGNPELDSGLLGLGSNDINRRDIDGTELAERGDIENRPKDRSALMEQTVYFDLDRSNIKPNEHSKVETVASYLRSNPSHDLLIEGHCDERGTEGYNLALGERRALSLREHLISLGVSPNRLHTISYGESVPAVNERNETAYARNRRGEFVVVLP
jgi:peptidoglycan-associated lipoprotein